MIKALLRSEWIKFRSYYLALGAALVALVVVPFFLMNLDYSQTAVGQTKALSEALHALYLAQPVIVIFTSLYFAQEFVKSGMRTNFPANQVFLFDTVRKFVRIPDLTNS